MRPASGRWARRCTSDDAGLRSQQCLRSHPARRRTLYEPCTKVYEDEFALAFENNRPAAPIHLLVIPKGEYVSAADFAASASPEQIVGFWRAVGRTASKLGLDGPGIPAGRQPRRRREPGGLPSPCPYHRWQEARERVGPSTATHGGYLTVVIDAVEHFGYCNLRRHIQAAALYESFISTFARGRRPPRPDVLAPAAARAFLATEERAMSLLSPFRRHRQVDGSAGIGKGSTGYDDLLRAGANAILCASPALLDDPDVHPEAVQAS